MKFLVTFRPNWWIIGAIFEEICIYVEENEGFGQPLIPFILLIGELQMGPYMVTYWCVSECCSLIGSHRLYVYRNASVFTFSICSVYRCVKRHQTCGPAPPSVNSGTTSRPVPSGGKLCPSPQSRTENISCVCFFLEF